MWIKIVSYLTVVGSSMLKMILGPGFALALKLSFVESVLLTTLGMMLTIILFTSFLGKRIRRWFVDTFFKNKKVFSKTTRRMVKIWGSYGLIGTAFLTPILLSPVGGGLVVNSFGGKRTKIYGLMLISALFWSTIYTYIFYQGITLFH